MEDSNNSRRVGGGTGLPRSTFAEDFFGTDPFSNFDPSPPSGGAFSRRFADRNNRFFDNNDLDRFFGDHRFADTAHPFRDEPSFFRSSFSNRRAPPPAAPPPSFTPQSAANASEQQQQHGHGGMERPIPIPVQRQQTFPTAQQQQPNMGQKTDFQPPNGFQHHRSKSHYDNVNGAGGGDNYGSSGDFHPKWDYHPNNRFSHYSNSDAGADQQPQSSPRFRHFPSQQPQQHPNDPNVHVINVVRQPESPPMPSRSGSRQFVEINNAQPNYSNGALNPDKRRRFSNARPLLNEHKNMKNVSRSIPDITIEDYGDGRRSAAPQEDEEQQQPLPTVIPLPPPAIPLPAPPGMATATISAAGKQEVKKENNGKNNENGVPMMSMDGEGEGNKRVKKISIGNDDTTQVESDGGGTFQNANGTMMNQQNDDDDEDDGKIIGNDFVPLTDNDEQLIRMLDDTEKQVELLRETAARLEMEKATILDTIKNIKLTGGLIKFSKDDRDELLLNLDRISARCKAVDVCVNIIRDDHQRRALEQVNQVLESVIGQMQADLVGAKAKIQGFLNACDPDENGHVDEKFQSLTIACTADDQKKIRRRLSQLIEQIERTEKRSGS